MGARYDATTGCHELEDGRSVDVTRAFSHGLVRFEKPLHGVLASTGETRWPRTAIIVDDSPARQPRVTRKRTARGRGNARNNSEVEVINLIGRGRGRGRGRGNRVDRS